jgi:hypothetical protein
LVNRVAAQMETDVTQLHAGIVAVALQLQQRRLNSQKYQM